MAANKKLQSLFNESISTPPSELRKQNSRLRNELEEAYEFFDNERRILMEDASAQNQNTEQQKEEEDLKMSLSHAETLILDYNKQISNLKDEISDLNKKREEESAQFSAMRQEFELKITGLQSDLRKKEIERDNLEKNSRDFEFTLKLKCDSYENRIKELQKVLADAGWKNSVSNGEEAVKESKSSINELHEKLQNENESLKLQLKEQEDKISDLESIKKRLKEEIGNLQLKHEETIAIKNGLTEELTNLQVKYEETSTQNRDQLNAIKEKNEELNGTIIKLLEMEKEIRNKHEMDLKFVKEEWINEVGVLKSEKDSLNDIIRQLNEELTSANDDLRKTKADFGTNLRNVKKEYESKIDVLRTEKNELDNEMKILKGKFEDLEKVQLKVADASANFTRKFDSTKEDTEGSFGSCVSELHMNIKQEPEKLVHDSTIKFELSNLSCNADESDYQLEITMKKETVDEPSFVNQPRPLELVDFLEEFRNNLIAHEICTREETELTDNLFYLLLDKHLALRTEYHLFRTSKCAEIESKAFECLNEICSQLEASDSSLSMNASANYTSFLGDIRSSTMCEPSELETTLVNDATLLTKDPLSLTSTITPFKTNVTPFKTPLKSARKNLTVKFKPTENELEIMKLKETVNEKDKSLIELRNKVVDFEKLVNDKTKEIEKLETRIFKLEDLATLFNGEKETLRDELTKDIEKLKVSLTKKTDELSELRDKLVLETISLNPMLESSIANISSVKILSMFMETIMENCKNMTEKYSKEKESDLGLINSLREEINSNEVKLTEVKTEVQTLKKVKAELTLKQKESETLLTNKNEEIRLLYIKLEETARKVNSEAVKNLEVEIKNLKVKIEEGDADLKAEINEKEKILEDLKKSKEFYENTKLENETLKERISSSEEMICKLQDGLKSAKLTQTENEVKVKELMAEIEELKEALSDVDVKNEDLKHQLEDFEAVKKLNDEMNTKLTETEDLLRKKEELVTELRKNKEETVEALNLRIQDLASGNEQIETLSNALSLAESKNTELMEAVSNLKQNFEELRKSKEGEIENLSKKLILTEERLKVTEETRLELEETQKKLSSADKLTNELQVKTCQLEKQLLEIEEFKNNEIKILTSKLAETEDQLKSDRDALTNELAEKTQKLLEVEEFKNNEIKILTSKLAETEDQLKSDRDALTNELKVKNTQLQNLLSDTEESKNREIKILTSETNQLRTDLNALTNELAEKTQKLLEIEEFKNNEIKILTSKLAETEDKLKLNLAQSQKAKIELEEARKDISLSKEVVSRLNSRIEELSSQSNKIQELNNELEKSDSKYKELEDLLKFKITAKNEEIEVLNLKLEKAEDRLRINSNSVEEAKAELQLALRNLINSNELITKNEQELRTKNGEIQKLKAQIEDFEDKIKKLQERLEETEIGFSNKLATLLESKTKDLETIQKSKNLEIETLTRKILEMDRNLLESQKNLESSNEIVCQLRTRIEELNVQLETFQNLKKELEIWEKKCKKLEKTVEISDRNFEDSEETVRKLQKTVKNLQESEKSKMLEIENLKSRLIDFENLIKNQSEEINRLQKDLIVVSKAKAASKTGRKSDLSNRRMDNLEELNHLLLELVNKLMTCLEVPNWDKLGEKLFSVRNFNVASESVLAHVSKWLESKKSEIEELKKQMVELDDECESYCTDIKSLKKKECVLLEENLNLKESLEAKISHFEKEEKEWAEKVSSLEVQIKDLKNSTNARGQKCQCSKKLEELKVIISRKEQRILQLEELETKAATYKSQIKYLENSLSAAKRKCHDEEEKIKKLEAELKQLNSNQIPNKANNENQLLNQLRNSLGGGTINENSTKEVVKLKKDNDFLKNVCRTQKLDIEKLKAENTALKNSQPKNSNQMNSPIRTRCYNTRSRKLTDGLTSPRRIANNDKENQ